MLDIQFFKVHRTWEDWFGLVLAVLIGLSPWLAGQQDHPAVIWNAILLGLLVLALSAFEFVDLHRWEETGEAVCGLWLIASPFSFGYADDGMLRYWHFTLGAVVVLLALAEIWQDWRLSAKQLAQHGQ